MSGAKGGCEMFVITARWARQRVDGRPATDRLVWSSDGDPREMRLCAKHAAEERRAVQAGHPAELIPIAERPS